MRWLCLDECSWNAKHGKRAACPMCTGYTTIENATKKRWWHAREIKEQRADRLAYKASLTSVAAAQGEGAAATEHLAGAA